MSDHDRGNKMDHDASNGGAVSGPARSLRPRRPRQGVNVDEQAMHPDLITVSVPFQRRTCATCANAGKGNIAFLRFADELRHFEEAHRRSRLTFRCRNCHKEFDRRHAADCHRPKCPGHPPAEEGQECEICGKRYATAIGLGQHQRHKHPAARNEARRAAAEVPRNLPAPRLGRVWTAEEVRLLAELEERFKNEKFIAKAISEVLTTKTAKQIRDKRADFRRRQARQRPEPAVGPAVPEQALVGDPEELSSNSDSVASSSSVEEWTDALQDPPAPQTVEEIPVVVECTSDSMQEKREWVKGFTSLETQGDLDGHPESEDVLKQINDVLEVASFQAGEISQEEIDRLYSLVLSFLPEIDSGRRRPKRRGSGKRAFRRFIYARSQDLYNKNPGLLAKYVRNNIDYWVQGEHHLQVEEVKELYESLWGTKPDVQLPDFGDLEESLPLSDLLTPISTDEVRGRIARTKTDTAPGLDGIKKHHLASRGAVQALRNLFNLLLISGKQPTSWGRNRTVLIPKEGKDPSKCENYRPLTISSLLCRLYWGIIDMKLRKHVRCTPRQKGFVAERGCYNNVHILNEILAYSKVQGGLVAVQLDMSKAFDTIPHEALGPALRKKGIHEHVVQLVCRSYQDVQTNIQFGGNTIPISLQRGVKQGDPMSPLLFNLVVEPLLLALENQSGFKINEAQNISCLAFADDLFLLASDVPQARNLLSITESYLSALGMTLSAPKCVAFQVVPTRDSFYIKDPGLVFRGGERVPYASAETRLEYLGMKLTPWAGIELGNLRTEMIDAVRRVKRLALKPHQKVRLISTYLIPHYLYRLVLGVVPVTALRNLDGDLRGFVKEILHLPACTSNGLLYAGKKDGGLGFPKLEIICVSSSLKSGLSFLNNPDPAIKALARATGLENRLRSQARAVRLNWPVESVAQVDRWKAGAKKRELQSWGECTSQGKAVHNTTNDKIGNAWLYNPNLLKPGRFLTALRLRTDTAGSRVAMNRATPQWDTQCRKCRVQLETLAHILGQCTHTKAERIRRHDSIVNLVMAEIPKRDNEAVVIKEPRMNIASGVLKPDLVVESQGRVLVVDVTVRHEDGDYLENGRRDKINKYSPLLPILNRDMGTSHGEVLPIVVGTRGAMPRYTLDALKRLGIKDRKTLLTMSMLALRASIEIYHNFIDYDGPASRRRREPP